MRAACLGNTETTNGGGMDILPVALAGALLTSQGAWIEISAQCDAESAAQASAAEVP